MSYSAWLTRVRGLELFVSSSCLFDAPEFSQSPIDRDRHSMPCFVISYGIRNARLEEAALESFANRVRTEFQSCSQQFDGTCIVMADTTADEIRDRLALHLADGCLFVARINQDAAWKGLEAGATEWLVEHL